jgi:hypothetical protein
VNALLAVATIPAGHFKGSLVAKKNPHRKP